MNATEIERLKERVQTIENKAHALADDLDAAGFHEQADQMGGIACTCDEVIDALEAPRDGFAPSKGGKE